VCGGAGTALDAREVNDSSLQADDRRVRPVIGVEFRKNALDAPFDGVFCDAELIGNLLVRVPVGDQAQHHQFGRCQRLIADVLSELERRLRRQTPFASVDRRMVCSESEWSLFLSR
jgi:hypothetical protein